MSIFDKVKDAAMHQFIEVIEWLDNTGDTIVYRFPVEGQEIKNGAQLIVRESQTAVFVTEGQVADVFTPGKYTIDGGNTPILTKLGAWKYGFDSPFKSEVYFVNTKQFTDMKWGTSNPIMLRDADFGIVQLRAFGAYSLHVVDSAEFIKQIAGTNAQFNTEDIDVQLKRAVVTEFTDALGELKIPALDLAAQYKEMGEAHPREYQRRIQGLGPRGHKILYREHLRSRGGPKGDRQARLDGSSRRRSESTCSSRPPMLCVTLLKMKAAVPDWVRDSVPGLPSAARWRISSASRRPAASKAAGRLLRRLFLVRDAASQINPTAKFCADCGAKMEVAPKVEVPCVKCGALLREGAKFCSECGCLTGEAALCQVPARARSRCKVLPGVRHKDCRMILRHVP